jgi:hypothetical protein
VLWKESFGRGVSLIASTIISVSGEIKQWVVRAVPMTPVMLIEAIVRL